MNRETIEKAMRNAVQARCQCNWDDYPCEERDYCEFCNGHNSAFDCDENCDADAFSEGFIAGAQWRINSVWHNACDIAEPGKDCLVEHMDGDGNVCIRIDWRSEYEWVNACHYDKVLRWAYIEDLLPDRKEDGQ